MKNEYIVKYTKQLYSYKIISQAINDYRGICSVLVTDSPEEYICKFHLTKEKNQIIINEFDNYLIELMCADK